MARTVTGTVLYPDGAAWEGATVYFELVDAFETSTTVYPANTVSAVTNSLGAFSIALAVPDTGTAHYQCRLPDDSAFHFYIAAGAAVDLVTLITIAGTSVAQSDLQTLLDAAALFTTVYPTSTYQMLVTDGHIIADGTFTITLIPATADLIGLGVLISNVGTGVITVVRSGTDTINIATSVTIAAGVRYTFIIGSAGVWRI